MPERVKAVERAVEKAYDGPWVWNGAIGMIDDPSMTQEQYDDATDKVDDIYETVVRHIDWNRVLLDALGRCMTFNHEHCDMRGFGRDMHYMVCGESVQEALLIDETMMTAEKWKRREQS